MNLPKDNPRVDQFQQFSFEIQRTLQYANGNTEFGPDNPTVEEVEVEYSPSGADKDVDIRAEYEDSGTEYIEFKRINLNKQNWASHVFGTGNTIENKFRDIGTNSENNTVGIRITNSLPESEIRRRIKKGIEENLGLENRPSEISFTEVRVITPDGETYTVDVSQYT